MTRTIPTPAWPLPVVGAEPPRPDSLLLKRFERVSAATACAILHKLGIRRTWLEGPTPLAAAPHTVGVARTLLLMPQREDVVSGLDQEYVERHSALWRVFDDVMPGDMLVVQANGAPRTGCVGEILATAFAELGGRGIVVDGRVRDTPALTELGLPVWCTGATPHYASQDELFPWGFHVPVQVGGCLVLPGDIIVADRDGAVVVPARLAEAVADRAEEHEDWEAFSRDRVRAGARLSDYYPLNEATRREFEKERGR
ncbi:dimethylmenaquinone methyltransferase [Jiangella alba]|uniref:Putative 4-hydroxy-4-methyl-2-oxoglutarate aldolase n=1 Tax=Jiangella alba TaxID=561176 RepID=A0A1H5LD23_9ACTN|nr:dimethylmenaquinone methyltransferase [Jiangella alba]SEE74953.1 Regulator of RNase E activity RraA [Jiangella alba]